MSEEEKEFYWCDNRHDMIQIYTSVKNPKCPICGHVMTLGRWWQMRTVFAYVKLNERILKDLKNLKPEEKKNNIEDK